MCQTDGNFQNGLLFFFFCQNNLQRDPDLNAEVWLRDSSDRATCENKELCCCQLRDLLIGDLITLLLYIDPALCIKSELRVITHWQVTDRRERERKNRRSPTVWRTKIDRWRERKRKMFLIAHRKSILLMWLIRSRLHRFRVSTLFPAIASLSRAQSRSTTTGMWGKPLKESPKLQSCTRLPSSSGRESKRFPSKHSVCKLKR